MPLITHARALRRNPTDAERALWQHLRGNRLQGLKFRRQHPMAATSWTSSAWKRAW